MAYRLRVKSISTDGTSVYITASLSDGPTTFPDITPVFSAQESAANVDTYMQAIVDAQPALSAGLKELAGKVYTQA